MPSASNSPVSGTASPSLGQPAPNSTPSAAAGHCPQVPDACGQKHSTSHAAQPHPERLRPLLLRRTVQSAFALFLIWVGYDFYRYVQWATGHSQTFIPKPPSVEGFLPISELMAARRLLVTGMWDAVHPAGLTLFLAIGLMALVFRKGFCGYICPVGFVSDMLARLGKRLGLSRELPPKLEMALRALKYVPLALLAYFSLFAMSLPEINAFLGAPFNMAADSSMMFFFLHPSATTITVIAVIAAASLFIRNAWCRFLCPYGAFLGLLALASPVAVARNASACTGCRRCSHACPSAIAVHEKQRVNTPECLGCAACIEACPQQHCLNMTAAGRRTPFWIVALGCVALLLVSYAWAVHTGHWASDIPPTMLRRFHMLQFGG